MQRIIEDAWQHPRHRRRADVRRAVEEVIGLLDAGRVRVAAPGRRGWRVHGWVKEAILLYFLHRDVEEVAIGAYLYRDQIPLKRNLAEAGVRVVPPGTVRYGAFLEPGVVVMPGYVNIGAYVGAGTMIDTWATVGSCAQVGRRVHVSGGAGIGGVLEPIQAEPVIIEDDVFLGSRCVVVEGVRVGRGAVLGSGVILTASTPILDVRGRRPKTMRGAVPPRAVVIPGAQSKSFPAGAYHVPCALIIGERSASTEAKTALNDVLRRFEESDPGGGR
ncbi:MAG: 2,3,4,5-tetrahydropyridine-2,6-dicarboxylate N-succinyltransferase [Candidatus Eisenbacteria bacterium]|nr:2,3,4,5-tetrahydropyridine-2,6-dicarboxylate N-succinyltransferase [Candidatus Eisenbacteria bacterium]